jgi:hypothetical protein
MGGDPKRSEATGAVALAVVFLVLAVLSAVLDWPTLLRVAFGAVTVGLVVYAVRAFRAPAAD